ncbi:polymorphic toxin type 37 domain-containing protein [Candidatus Protochlamydia phocaeensis]|uniref:polymorphic toxin type 37 domain-containing protein n=1 Tax=Candidatus Protochlamydia phocaeensis TaxID=1414722 RepID=UPI000839465E|nr:polymorphic toxin type 37 domain-containing protein [Candidatus Protochlamydia phocaeensis]
MVYKGFNELHDYMVLKDLESVEGEEGFYKDKAGKEDKEKEARKPKYDGRDLGNDPTKCPGEGFEWKGEGKPGSKEGNWANPKTKEWLRPDLDHPEPKKPHWDYGGRTFPEEYRLFLDSIWELK